MSKIDRSALIERAAGLDWPVVGVSSFAIGGEAAWRKAVRQCFPVELEDLARQLDRIEADRPEPLPARRSALDPLPMMNAEELEAQRAEWAEQAEDRARERARQDEALRQKILSDHGII